ncbi:GGDEF domain-containing protein [Thalassotalea sediminis]|uniref:GGDEF domain-containing protein n=1 Tax=Thalassotalea sediminis TaxID=1759089 RepID=UPI0025729C5C|nr:GGDEF domain-containing protein [Thalassotalea sediminis]
MIKRFKFAYIFIPLFLISLPSFAEQAEATASELLEQKQKLPVDDRIKDLVAKSRNEHRDVEEIFLRLQQQSDTFNLAEKYLMLIVDAYLAKQKGDYTLGVEKLTQALSYEKSMNEAQINTPEFSKIHLLLAELYEAQQEFKRAYDEKKIYLDKSNKYRTVLREERLANLNKKYETDLKLKENEVLASQQKLKALQLADAAKQRESQQRNLAILMVTALIFLVLLIRQLKIRSKLRHLAKTDSLTGLYNRRILFKRGEALLQEALTKKTPLSVMMIDIDHFKSINDTYGHDIGDKAIVEVAKLGKETLRAKDIFARIGGEEFAIVLPNTELKEAKAIAERLREKVQKFSLEVQATAPVNVKTTISIGVTAVNEQATDFDALLHLADEAMYRAKSLGRNQVCH